MFFNKPSSRSLLKALPLLLLSCTSKPQIVPPATDNFPPEIGRIMLKKCATAGCHNTASYQNAGGLLLDSWEHLFEGGVSGAAVVAYSVAYSPLLYFINTDSTEGPVAEPLMPLNNAALTREEYRTIRDWIAAGAADKNGNKPFGDNAANRQKIYMVHQSCDVVGVIDAEKSIVMRYIPVGKKPYPESLTYIRMSADGAYAYACFWYSNEVYQIDTRTDQVVRTFSLDNNFWSMMHVSADGLQLALTNGDDHRLAIINTVDGQVRYQQTGNMVNPMGITSNAAFSTFYITSQYGNTLYKLTDGKTQQISIDGNALTTKSSATPDPYEIVMAPDDSRYFISCTGSAELRVFNAADDRLLKVIKTGKQPTGMTIATSKPYLFVACTEDDNTAAGFKGSVYVIDYQTLETVRRIEGDFYQPHSITLNERDHTFYVFSRNQNYNGPAPHHKGPCSGRNGYYNVYDLNTLQPRSRKRHEVLVDPYSSATRFRN